jgi:hypothetical protein
MLNYQRVVEYNPRSYQYKEFLGLQGSRWEPIFLFFFWGGILATGFQQKYDRTIFGDFSWGTVIGYQDSSTKA